MLIRPPIIGRCAGAACVVRVGGATGYIKTTIGKHIGGGNVTNLNVAHTEIESGCSVGKIVLEYFRS